MERKTASMLFLFLIYYLLIPPFTGAQNLPPDDSLTVYELGEKESVISLVQGDKILYSEILPDPAMLPFERTRVIIRLTEPSVGAFLRAHPGANSGQLNGQRHQVEAQHIQFGSRLNQIENQLRQTGVLDGPATVIHYEYLLGLNGFAIEAHPEVISRLGNLNIVAEIEEDGLMEAFDALSNAAIDLPCFQAAHPGIDGTGIRMGIIDSGIDDAHPEFATHTIVWEDFTSTPSATPVDPNGHGTHVAGIAAGSGPNPGVAPGVDLYIYRVFGAGGSGTPSSIIAAIERAMDPNMDLNTADRLDVINLSLGGDGTSQSLVSQTVNNATAVGVVVVAAAGNDGSDYYTVKAPGLAESAICVGAVNSSSILQGFSSRGPGNFYFDLKPDMLAPGYSISSAQTGTTGYVQKNGTSMAAPHVAGAAALLLQLNSGRSPGEIKSILMQGADDLGLNEWQQGQGELNLCNSAAQSCAVVPASISFGLYDCNSIPWSQSATVTIHNYSGSLETYNITPASGGFPLTGVNFTATPPILNIPAGSSGTFTVNLTVTAACPDGTGSPTPYIDYINVSSATCTEQIPVSFQKGGAVLQLNYDVLPALVVIHDHSTVIASFKPVSLSHTMYLPSGTYDFMAMWGDGKTKVVQENVVINSCPPAININTTDAIYTWAISELDESGGSLVFKEYGANGLNYVPANIALMRIGYFSSNAPWNEAYLSPFSIDYQWDARVRNHNSSTGNYYDFPFKIPGPLSKPGTLQNDPADFIQTNHSYYSGPGVSTMYYSMEPMFVSATGATNIYAFKPSTPTLLNVLKPPFAWQKTYVAPNPPGYMLFPGLNHFVWDISAGYTLNDNTLLYHGAMINGGDATIKELRTFRFQDYSDPMYYSPTATDIHFGHYAPRWMAVLDNLTDGSSYTEIVVRNQRPWGFFADQFGNLRLRKVNYSVFDPANSLVASGTLDNGTTGSFVPLRTTLATVPSVGNFAVEMSWDHYEIVGVPGIATARMEFNSSTVASPNVPWLERMFTRSNGVITDLFFGPNDNEILFRLTDPMPAPSGISLATAEYRKRGSSAWQALTVSYDATANYYWAKLPCDLPKDHYDLRITGVNGNGGKLIYTCEPGFYFSPVGSPLPDWAWAHEATDLLGPSYALTNARDAADNSYVGGFFNGQLDFATGTLTGGNTANDMFLAKYDPSGNELWQIANGGAGFNAVLLGSHAESGKVGVTGFFRDPMTWGAFPLTGTALNDILISQVDATGTVDWAQVIHGAGNNAGNGIVSRPGGGYYVTGIVRDNFTAGATAYTNNPAGNIFVAAYDGTGSLQWLNLYGTQGKYCEGKDITVDANGDIFLAAVYTGSVSIGPYNYTATSGMESLLIKLDKTGNVLRVYRLGSNTGFTEIKSVNVNLDGDVIVQGRYYRDITTGGGTWSALGTQTDLFTARYGNNGFLWLHQFGGGISEAFPGGADIDDLGRTFTTTAYRGSVALPPLGTLTAPPGEERTVVIRLDEQGIPDHYVETASGMPRPSDIVINESQSVWVSGTYFGNLPVQFDGHIIPPPAGNDMWHARIEGQCLAFPWSGWRTAPLPEETKEEVATATPSTDGATLPGGEAAVELKGWPNPFTGQVNLAYALPGEGEVKLEIFNATGQLVAMPVQGPRDAGLYETSVDLRAMGEPAGIYLVRLTYKGEALHLRLIMQ